MNRYGQYLQELFEKNTNPQNRQLLTLYLPTSHKTKLEINEDIKSSLLSEIHNNPILKETLNQHILEVVQKLIHQIDLKYQGLAIFINLDSIKEADILIVPLFIEPIYECRVSPQYNIDQLLWQNDNEYRALIINITKEICNIYELNVEDFKLIKSKKNEWLESKEDSNTFRQAASPTNAYHKFGEHNLLRREDDAVHDFMINISDFIKEQTGKEQYDYILIFYSSSFSSQIEEYIKDHLKSIHSTIIFDAWKTNEIHELEVKSKEIVEMYIDNHILEKLNETKEQFYFYTQDLNEIIAANQLNNIEILFLTPNVHEKGYIWENKYPVAEKIEGSKEAGNVVPWIIQNTYNTKGQVLLIKKDPSEIGIKLAAKIRYKLK